MSHSILLTGTSDYLAGTIANAGKAQAIEQYGFEPLTLDLTDEASVTETILDHEISIIYFLIDSVKADAQVRIIKALAQVKEKTGQDVHFLHTSGAKLFSGFVGHPTGRPLLDTEEGLYEIQKNARGPFEVKMMGVRANTTIIDTAESYGVQSYIFAPCIAYGEGKGFGNNISIQTVAIVQAAKALRRVYRTQSDKPGFGYGKKSFFLAASGSVAWDDLYDVFAESLAKRNIVDDETVHNADEAVLEKTDQALACPKELVPVKLSGKCTFTAGHGEQQLGWKPQYRAEHILEAADAEVETILKYLKTWEPGHVR
ncbi:hypothetical protein DTO027B5_1018 [Paecilomyces variotii]|nr:hypothetical protein DTO027B3_2447 [Paecilomyces variotii]KAJ9337220.1 hypothetical protein DTO027B5_1018 [Paecilomyces variotii]